jgi:RNA polymerase sigma-70 factor (ECF subfamily)
VGNRTAAEDVTQEALLSIWRSGARYDRAKGSVRGWTLGIVRNRAIDLLRKESGRSPKLAAGGEELLERSPAEGRTDAEALRRETAREVRGAIEHLPEDQSRVIQLAYYGGFSHSEIAEMLNEPLGTIKGRMRLGMDKIRSTVAEGW